MLRYECANKEGEVMNRIKELREKKGMSIDQLSKELKERGVSISPASISKYEREERKPKIDKWVQLADFFNVPIPYLQGTSDVSNWEDEKRKNLKSVRNAKAHNDDKALLQAYENIRKSIAVTAADNSDELKLYFRILSFAVKQEPADAAELVKISNSLSPLEYQAFVSMLPDLLKMYLYATTGRKDKKSQSALSKIVDTIKNYAITALN